MQLSIKHRVVLTLNVLVILVGLTTGWIGVHYSGQVTERRLVNDALNNAVGLVTQMQLPLSPRLLQQLGQILDSEVIAWERDGSHLIGTTVGQPATEALTTAWQSGESFTWLRLGPDGELYRVALSDVPAGSGRPATAVLALLVPQKKLVEAKRHATRRITTAAVPVIAGATVIGLWLAWTIAAPISHISTTVRTLAERTVAAGTGDTAAARFEFGIPSTEMERLERGPPEVRALLHDVDRLLQCIQEMRARLTQHAQLVALGQFSATIAHELRNPLSGIRMNAEVLRDASAATGTDPDPSIDVILTEAERMRFFLDELLAMADPGKGRDTAQTASDADTAAYPAALATRIVAAVQPRLDALGVAAAIQIPEQLAVACPEQQVRSVLFNLVLNALDAMPDGGTLTLSAEAADKDSVRIEVRDSGSGIPDTVVGDVFAPFVTTKERGTGLGLHICRRLVETHAGQIGHERRNDVTVFWFALPRLDRAPSVNTPE